MFRVALSILLSVSILAAGDIVYLSDGREIEGKARKTGKEVVVTLRDGTEKTFPASAVLYIAVGPLREKPPAKPTPRPPTPGESTGPVPLPRPIPTPTSQPAKPHASDLAALRVEMGPPPEDPLTSFNTVEPEPIVYLILRNRRSAKRSTASTDPQLRICRARAHDRKRQFTSKWQTPEDVHRQRKAFLDLLVEAREQFRNAKLSSNPTDAERNRASRYRAAGQARLRDAARTWPDPLLRTFLLATAAYQSDDFTRALELYRQCVRQAPLIPAFQQGLAVSLLRKDQHLPAIEACMSLLRLRPDSREVQSLLAYTLQETPGTLLNTTVARDAQSRLDRIQSKRRLRHPDRLERTWIFPDETVRANEQSLPAPPVDRYRFRQALAVPVAPHALLVDRAALGDARAAYVRIGPDHVVPAEFRLRRTRDDPVAVLEVESATFTPAVDPRADAPAPATAGQQAQVLACDFYAAMGNDLRRRVFRLPPPAQPPEVTMAPGEPAGPVFANGKLVGFLPGWLDVRQDTPPTAFLALADLDRTLRRARRRGRTDDDTPPQKPLPGKAFLVCIIAADNFSED